VRTTPPHRPGPLGNISLDRFEFDRVDRSAFAFGPQAKAKVVNQSVDGASRRDVAGEIISKLDALIRGVEEHWEVLPDPGELRRDLKAVSAEVRDQEPDKFSISRKLNRAVTRLAPVTALTELAASIGELVSHLP
jgi:hypothetical protein